MQVTKITKGQIITNTETGRRYTVLTTKPHSAGTMDDYGQANYVTMVRPIHVGRAFDLIISQALLDMGIYTVAPAAK